MTTLYPVVEYKTLLPARQRGPLGILGRRRDLDELPVMQAHHVRVFRVGGEYVLDNGRRQLDDELVVDASDVSVVDLTRNAPVQVELGIPSAEGTDFTVRVSFVCTVTDAIAVVRDGQRDAALGLLHYLRSHHRIFELGLDRDFAQINEVRRTVKAQVEAFTQLKPPQISGLTVALSSVEVLTPEELAELHRKLHQQEREHALAYGTERYGFELKRSQARNESALQRERREFEQGETWDGREFQHRLAAKDRTWAIETHEVLTQYLQGDPRATAAWAAATGEISTKELLGLQQADREREAARADEAAQREQADRHSDRRLTREELEADRAWKRQQVEADRAWKREERARQLELEERRASASRQDRQAELDRQIEMLRILAQTGHLDTVQVGLDQIIEGVSGGAIEQRKAPQLDSSEKSRTNSNYDDGERAEMDDDQDDMPREEG